MLKKILFYIHLGSLLNFFGLPAEAAPRLTVSECAWANAIQYHEPVSPYTAAAPLYFWTKIQGNAEALEVLKRKRVLLVEHIWQRLSGTRFRVVDQIRLPIRANEELINGFEWEVKERGFFDWRTFSVKQNLPSDYWKVRVYYNRRPIRFEAYCESEIWTE